MRNVNHDSGLHTAATAELRGKFAVLLRLVAAIARLCLPDANTDTHAYSYTDTYSYTHAYPYTNAHTSTHTDSDAYSYANTCCVC